jgi:nucleoside-diphosphate-sugar epimerase
MRIVIAGAHGRVARRLGRLLVARGDTVVGIVRTSDHEADLAEDGVEPVELDLEYTRTDDLASVLVDAEAVVFAAGAGPGSTILRKDTVDRAAAVLLADAAEQAAVRPYLMMSSMGVEAVAAGNRPDGIDDVFYAYLLAKLAAEDGARQRPAIDLTILRPGILTEEPGTGTVTLGRHVPDGSVSRDDVAAVMLALLDAPRPGEVIELVSGPTPVAEAVAALGPTAAELSRGARG